MTNSVAKPSKKSLRSSAALVKIRTLRAGVEAMRAAGETYLPKEERESRKDYDSRVARSWLFPGLDKAIEDVADRVFAREVAFGDDVPSSLVELEGNITNEGRNLNTFARDVFEDGVESGVAFILVDCPRKSEGMTIAQQRASNFRPYMVHIKAEDVLGWKTATINNITHLAQVRILETVHEDDPEDEFAQKEIEQVRVLTLTSDGVWVRLYRKGSKGEWSIHEEFLTDTNEITMVPFYTNRTGFFTAKPRYEKLADLNIAHWQSASDQRNILHKVRVPLLALFGFDTEDVTTSANSALVTSRSKQEADIKWIEHKGEAIGAGRDDLKDLEERMQILGVELAWKPASNSGATGAAIDHDKATTPLSMMANNLKDALEQALNFMAMYQGEKSGGSVDVNTDFGVSLLGQADLTFLLNAVNTGQISQETFLKECMRRNVLMDDLVIDDEIERIDEEAPAQVSMPDIDEEE